MRDKYILYGIIAGVIASVALLVFLNANAYATSNYVCYDYLEVDITPTPTEEPTPTPVEEEKHETGGTPPVFAGSSTDAPGVCKDDSIGRSANIFVKTTGNTGELEVQWALVPGADRAHIVYGLGQSPEHALLDTENDGSEVIRNLKSGQHYWFAVMGVKGCATGPLSSWYDPIVP